MGSRGGRDARFLAGDWVLIRRALHGDPHAVAQRGGPAMAQVLVSVPIGAYLHRVSLVSSNFIANSTNQIWWRFLPCGDFAHGVTVWASAARFSQHPLLVDLPQVLNFLGLFIIINRCGRQLFTLRRVEGRSGPRTVENITRDPNGVVSRGGRVHGRHFY